MNQLDQLKQMTTDAEKERKKESTEENKNEPNSEKSVVIAI